MLRGMSAVAKWRARRRLVTQEAQAAEVAAGQKKPCR